MSTLYGSVRNNLYDGLGRLSESDPSGDEYEKFRYDHAGNRTYWERMGQRWSYVYDSYGRLDSDWEQIGNCGTEYTYDAEGRRTAQTSTCSRNLEESYRYTADGRLVQLTKQYDGFPGMRVTRRLIFWYDGLGRRILLHSPDVDTLRDYGATLEAAWKELGTWRYYYSGNTLMHRSLADVATPDEEAAWTQFTPGLQANELLAAYDGVSAPTHKFYVRDHLGSTIEVKDQLGTDAGLATSYTAFGGVESGDPPLEASFAGGLAAGGLVQFHHRYYDPQTGQFTTEDPIGYAGGGNLYAYAANNPVNFSDPYGLNPLVVCVTPIGAPVCTTIAVSTGTVIKAAIGVLIGAAAGVWMASQDGDASDESNDRTADPIISDDKKGSIRRVFPGEMLAKTLKEIERIARDKKHPDRDAARRAKKLLKDKRFNKEE